MLLIALREKEKQLGITNAAQALNGKYLAAMNLMGETDKPKLRVSSSIADVYLGAMLFLVETPQDSPVIFS